MSQTHHTHHPLARASSFSILSANSSSNSTSATAGTAVYAVAASASAFLVACGSELPQPALSKLLNALLWLGGVPLTDSSEKQQQQQQQQQQQLLDDGSAFISGLESARYKCALLPHQGVSSSSSSSLSSSSSSSIGNGSSGASGGLASGGGGGGGGAVSQQSGGSGWAGEASSMSMLARSSLRTHTAVCSYAALAYSESLAANTRASVSTSTSSQKSTIEWHWWLETSSRVLTKSIDESIAPTRQLRLLSDNYLSLASLVLDVTCSSLPPSALSTLTPSTSSLFSTIVNTLVKMVSSRPPCCGVLRLSVASFLSRLRPSILLSLLFLPAESSSYSSSSLLFVIQKCTIQGWADNEEDEDNNLLIDRGGEERKDERIGAESLVGVVITTSTTSQDTTTTESGRSLMTQQRVQAQQWLDDNMHVLELGLAASVRMALDAVKVLLLALTEAPSSTPADATSSSSSFNLYSDENERIATLRLSQISTFLSTLASSAPATLTVTLDDLSCAGLGMLGTLSAGALRKAAASHNQNSQSVAALQKVAADSLSSLALSCIDSRPTVRLHAQEVLQTVVLHLQNTQSYVPRPRGSGAAGITPPPSLLLASIYPVCFAFPAAALVLACAIKPGVNIVHSAEAVLTELHDLSADDASDGSDQILRSLPFFSSAVTILSEARLAMKMSPNTDVLQSNVSSNPYMYAAVAAVEAAATPTSRSELLSSSPSSSSSSSSSSFSSRPTLTSGAPLFSPAASGARGLSPTPQSKTTTGGGTSSGGGDRVELSCERTISGVVQLVSRTFLNLLPVSSSNDQHQQKNREMTLRLVRLLVEVFEGALRSAEECRPPALPLQESLRECARNTIQVIRSSGTSTSSIIANTSGNDVITVSDALNAEIASGRFECLAKISSQLSV